MGIDFKEITIDDKLLFDSYIKQYNPQISEMTFTNLFMWRNFYKIRWVEIAGLLCIVSASLEKAPFAFMPVERLTKEKVSEAVNGLKEYFFDMGWTLQFKRISEQDLEYLREFVQDEEDVVLDRDNSDYIYLSESLATLKGKKYDGKRNHINRFNKEFSYEYVPLTEDLIHVCYHIMTVWCAERSCEDHRDLYCEKLANTELLKNFEKLGCSGSLLKVDGIYEAFTVGEMLNDDTAVIHIEKANGKIHGLYTLINQQFVEHKWQEATFINREQDLGMEGLRKAKLSYHPVKMVNKYTVLVR